MEYENSRFNREFFCRVDTQIAPVDDLGADTAGFWLKRADFVAVWAVKSALYAF